MQIQELWVGRKDLRKSKVVEREAAPLHDGEVRLAIDKFALTSNNVSYAISGEMIGYWKYFPAEGEWGKVPAWGFADVVESRCAELPVGERVWGFFPMASHVVLQPGKLTPTQFFDFAPHRKALPGLYNQYHRTADDPPPLKAMEDERCLLFPLFATSFVLYDYLIDHGFFGAEQVLIGSASSKTGFGLAWLLHDDAKLTQRVVGLTSSGNLGFVEKLGVCDQVVAYGDIATLDASKPAAFVDMAGSGAVLKAVHEHFRMQLKESCIVGATHWEADRKQGALPGPKPQFFFAPAHIAKREKDWGPGQVMLRAFGASARIAQAISGQLDVQRVHGARAVGESFRALIDNQVPPSRGLMLSFK
jgi:hypothetical protein